MLRLLPAILLCGICAAFQLPLMLSDGALDTDSLFGDSEYMLVIFWQTGCHECELALDAMHAAAPQFAQSGLPVVSVCFNPRRELPDALPIARRSTYPVLFDADAALANKYGASGTDFYLAIVDRSERQLWKLGESFSDADARALAAFREISAAPDVQFTQRESAEPPRLFDEKLRIFGTAKVRGVITSLTGDAHGAYGEPLVGGGQLNFLFRPALEYVQNEHRTIGTQLRFTDAGESEMRGAPDYFTNALFSPYIKASLGDASLIAGYYHENFSPLSLMRWDVGDNPPGAGGGQGGCRACAGLPGGVSFNNLEELGADYGFEGFHLSYAPAISHAAGDFRAFYARPTAEHSYCTYYLRHLFASSLGGTYTFGGAAFAANMRALNLQDEIMECDNRPYIRSKPSALWQNIVSAEASVAYAGCRIAAERLWCRTKTYPPDSNSHISVYDDFANMLIAQAKLKYENLFADMNFAYFDIGDSYRPEYAALSYYPGSQGIRGQVGVEFLQKALSAGATIFAKKLMFGDEITEIESYGAGFELSHRISSMRLIFSMSGAVEYARFTDTGACLPCQQITRTSPEPFRRNVGEIAFSVEPFSKLAITAAINYNENREGDAKDYNVGRVYYLMTSASF